MTTALVLGATGLLGSNLIRELSESGLDIVGTHRESSRLPKRIKNTKFKSFSIGESVESLIREVNPSLIFNCIVHKGQNQSKYSEYLQKSIYINTLFPRSLSNSIRDTDTFLFHFSTDAVFSGAQKSYHEASRPSPRTIYGATKFLGETRHPNGLLLRFSIVATKKDLCFRRDHLSARIKYSPANEKIRASLRPSWNGLTVGVVASIVSRLAIERYKPIGIRHLFTSASISRYELIEELAKYCGRNDLNIEPDSKQSNNSVLSTRYPNEHAYFWSLAGFTKVPTFKEILAL